MKLHPSRYANLLTQKVPLPRPRVGWRGQAPDFVRACRDYRTLRTAVEAVRALASLSAPDIPIKKETPPYELTGFYEGGSHPLAPLAGERVVFHRYPPEAFVGGRPWTWETEQSVWRHLFDALLAWGVLGQETVFRGSLRAFAQRVPTSAADFLTIVRELYTQGLRGFLLSEAPAWTWLGLSRDEVLENLDEAAIQGDLIFQYGGNAVNIEFPKQNGPRRRRRRV